MCFSKPRSSLHNLPDPRRPSPLAPAVQHTNIWHTHTFTHKYTGTHTHTHIHTHTHTHVYMYIGSATDNKQRKCWWRKCNTNIYIALFIALDDCKNNKCNHFRMELSIHQQHSSRILPVAFNTQQSNCYTLDLTNSTKILVWMWLAYLLWVGLNSPLCYLFIFLLCHNPPPEEGFI